MFLFCSLIKVWPKPSKNILGDSSPIFLCKFFEENVKRQQEKSDINIILNKIIHEYLTMNINAHNCDLTLF